MQASVRSIATPAAGSTTSHLQRKLFRTRMPSQVVQLQVVFTTWVKLQVLAVSKLFTCFNDHVFVVRANLNLEAATVFGPCSYASRIQAKLPSRIGCFSLDLNPITPVLEGLVHLVQKPELKKPLPPTSSKKPWSNLEYPQKKLHHFGAVPLSAFSGRMEQPLAKLPAARANPW